MLDLDPWGGCGPLGTVLTDWLASREQAWRDQITTALATHLSDAVRGARPVPRCPTERILRPV